MLSDERLKEIAGRVTIFESGDALVNPYIRGANAFDSAEMARELLSLRWQPITAENLPSLDDETGRWRTNRFWEVQSDWVTTDFSEYHKRRWTHRRPINPPAQTGSREEPK